MQGYSRNKRLASVDLFKLICAVAIVAMHTSALKGTAEELDFFFTHVLFRLAVPFFCMVTGYFLMETLVFENGRLRKCKENYRRIAGAWKKNAKLYAVWSIIYLIVYIPLWKRIGWLSAWAFVDWGIAAVRTGSYYHLWYVLSLLYALPILYVCLRVVDKKYFPIVAVLLYLIKVASYGYRGMLPDSWYPLFSLLDALGCVATALNTIIPYILLGMIAFERKERYSGVLFSISLALVTAEAFNLRKLGGTGYSYILFSMPAAYFFFQVVLSLNRVLNKQDFGTLARSSIFIYCVHPAVNAILEKKIVNVGFLRFICVFCLSFILSVAVSSIHRKIKKRRVENNG